MNQLWVCRGFLWERKVSELIVKGFWFFQCSVLKKEFKSKLSCLFQSEAHD